MPKLLSDLTVKVATQYLSSRRALSHGLRQRGARCSATLGNNVAVVVYLDTLACDNVYYGKGDIKSTRYASQTLPALVSVGHKPTLLSCGCVLVGTAAGLFLRTFLPAVLVLPQDVLVHAPSIAPRSGTGQVQPFLPHREALEHQVLLQPIDPRCRHAPVRVDLGEHIGQLQHLVRTESDELVLLSPLQQACLHGNNGRDTHLLEVSLVGGGCSGVEVVVCAVTVLAPPTPGEEPRRAGQASIEEALYEPGAEQHIQSLRYELAHSLLGRGVHLDISVTAPTEATALRGSRMFFS